MKETVKMLNLFSIISFRKALFYHAVVSEAKKKKLAYNREKIRFTVANIENEKFILPEEKKSNKLDPNADLETLELCVADFI